MSPWIIFLLFVLFTFISVISYRKMRTGNRRGWRILLFLRLLVLGVVFLLIADIKLSRTTKLIKIPEVRVYLDNSVSVAHHSSLSPDALKSGYEEIVAAIGKKASESEYDILVKLHSFGTEIRDLKSISTDIDFTDPSTDLSAIMESETDWTADRFVAGIVVVTDGQITSGSDLSKIASDSGIPLHIVGLGEETPMVDIHLERVDAPTVAVRGEYITAEAIISAIGNFREKVHVTLRRGTEVLGTKSIVLSGQGSLRPVRFQFQLNELGENKFNVQVSSLRRELNVENNRSSFMITALRDRFRVALITGVASPNSGLLKRILKSEDRFIVDHYVKTKAGWSKSIALFWRSEYDLVVLDNAPSKNMSKRWVKDLQHKLDREETALIFVAGSSVEEKQLPGTLAMLGLQELFTGTVDVTGKPLFKQDAIYHPVFSGFAAKFDKLSLPPITLSVSAEPKTESVKTAAILDETTEAALFTLGVYKSPESITNRRVAAFLSDGLWSLHFKTLRLADQQFVKQWWKRLFNWLAGTTGKETLYFRLNKTSYQQGEPVYVYGTVLSLDKSTMSMDQVVVKVIEEDGQEESVHLSYIDDEGQWQGGLHAFKPGEYKYVISVIRDESVQQETWGIFTVEESQVELNRVFLARQALETLADKSRGSYHSWVRREDVVNSLELSPREDVISSSRKVSHWIPLSIVILLLLTAEWILRRMWGLQ